MPTLHIDHAINDLPTWKSAFDWFATAREQAGVRGHRIQQPIDDSRQVVIDLDFDTTDQAQRFLHFLQTTVWASPENAPALVGAPHTRILQPVSEQ